MDNAKRYSITAITIHSLLLIVIIFQFDQSVCIEFNKEYTGVAFGAYVKRSENGEPIPGWGTYTMEDITTMLEVISGKFSNVATFGAGADNVPYERNTTYHSSNRQAYSAEAAALVNKERNDLIITMIIGIWQADILQQMETETKVALESAQRANEIFRGTTTGIVFSQSDMASIKRARQTLQNIRDYKVSATRLGLKVGTRQQKCSEITLVDTGDEAADKLSFIRRQIINESDFIICEVAAAEHNLPSGGAIGFRTVGNDLLGFKREFYKINPNLLVMGQTGWSSKGPNAWQNIDNLKQYWETANKFASENQFPIWLSEAFDNPWKDWGDKSAAHEGWWKLTQNSRVNQKDGYAEKIFAPPDDEDSINEETATMSPWVYVGIAIGAAILIFVLTLITLLFLRVNKLQSALSKDEIREFMHGISDETAAQQGGDGVVESALKFPYDKSYEIAKDKLKIKREALLGTGQFGCVYKAVIESENEPTVVALKMAKSDCPKSALKSLLSEIKILTYLGKHPNIVSIHGAYTAELLNGVVYVATELCTLGSLEGYLRKNPIDVFADRYANAPVFATNKNMNETEFVTNPEITFLDMVRWSHEIACGMEYLATKHVVHADLATRNVLLGADKTAKITDFGLSRRLYDYTNYVKQQQEPLPWRWMAVESLKRLEFSSQSDVWSYGVTLWEIFALGDLPYPGLSWNLEFVDSLVNGLRMKCPPHASPEIYTIMVDCWNLDPKQRPTFNDLKTSTGHIIDKCIGSNEIL